MKMQQGSKQQLVILISISALFSFAHSIAIAIKLDLPGCLSFPIFAPVKKDNHSMQLCFAA